MEGDQQRHFHLTVDSPNKNVGAGYCTFGAALHTLRLALSANRQNRAVTLIWPPQIESVTTIHRSALCVTICAEDPPWDRT